VNGTRPPPDVDALIRHAITQRRLLRFVFKLAVRVVEPHDYGLRNGVAQLLVFQVGGQSPSGGLPNWRWVMVSQASAWELLDATFPGGRAVPSGKHSRWDELFLRVEPAAAAGRVDGRR
jgi:hypothetical protein